MIGKNIKATIEVEGEALIEIKISYDPSSSAARTIGNILYALSSALGHYNTSAPGQP